MRTILIVDDEKNIRLGLQSMIEREYKNRYDIKLACDAFEALEILKSADIDILLTDIFMPDMDGIQLIEAIHSLKSIPLIVIVSGYDDFAYAKAAIRYNVKEYLLKPVIREELAKTVERMEEELARKEEVTIKLTASARQQEDYQQSQLNLYISHPAAPPDEVRAKLEQLKLQWLDNGFRILLMKYAGDIQTIGVALFKAQAAANLDSIFSKGSRRFVRFFDRYNHAVILLEGVDLSGELTGLEVNTEPQHIISASGPCFGMEKLNQAYEEASLALRYSFIRSTPGLVVHEDIQVKNRDYSIPAEKIRMIANMLGSEREKELLSGLHEVFDIAEISRNHIRYLERISSTFNEMVFDHVFRIYGKESVELLKRYRLVGNLYNFTFLHEYLREMEGLILLLNDYVKALKTEQIDNKEMKAALQYIHENYTRNINMTIISNVVSYNYSYFSQAFREYTGENFVTYLKKYRLMKAKELLATTDDKILEIAKKAGFENTKNFNRVFKESEGISPVEYRNHKKILL